MMKKRCGADHIVDLGPRGNSRRRSVAAGTLRDIERDSKSETARCLKTPLRHPTRGSRRSLRDVENWIEVHGARANNLKDLDVRFPIGRLSVITGISGSGKSTLMHEVLWPAVRDELEERKRAGNGALFKLVSGAQKIEAVYSRSIADRENVAVDAGHLHQSIRRNPESLCATAGLACARVFSEPILIQCGRRPLRELQRPWRDQARDEFPAEQLCAVRRLPRAPLQSANIGSPL